MLLHFLKSDVMVSELIRQNSTLKLVCFLKFLEPGLQLFNLFTHVAHPFLVFSKAANLSKLISFFNHVRTKSGKIKNEISNLTVNR